MPDTPDIRTEIAAFLAGDLSDAQAAAVQARIDSEPWVAAAADVQADLMMRLGAVDDVTPPTGYSQRLRTGLAAEIGHELALPGESPTPANGRSTVGASTVGVRASRGRHVRQGPDRRMWKVLGAAAAVVVVFIGSSAVLVSGGFGSSEDSTDSRVGTDERSAAFDSAESALSAEAPTVQTAPDERLPAQGDTAQDTAVESGAVQEDADSAAAADEDQATETAAAGAAEPQGGDDPSGPSGPDGPSIQDFGDVTDPAANEEPLRSLVLDDPAVQRLLGQRSDEGSVAIAQRYGDGILAAPPFPSGVAPGSCLDGVLTPSGRGGVPAVAAQLTIEGQARLAYALVTAEEGGTFDRVTIWVLDIGSCAVVSMLS